MTEIITKDNRLETLEQEIITLKNRTAENMILMGQKFIEAKKLVPHGEWGKWLEEKVGFSQRTANNFMRIANEYVSNSQAISNLDATKIYLLLELPAEEREDFVNQYDLQNMSTRDMKKKLNDYKRNNEIWKIVDKKRDNNKYEIPLDELKPLPDHEKYLGSIKGINYIEFLSSIQKYGVAYPILITRDKMIVDGHERVRACKDLGFQTIPAIYLCCSNENNLNIDDLLLHTFFIRNMHTRTSTFYLANAWDECLFGDKEKAKYYMNIFLTEGEKIDNEMEEWIKKAKKMIEEERMIEQRRITHE